jgi:hypothetical protein
VISGFDLMEANNALKAAAQSLLAQFDKCELELEADLCATYDSEFPLGLGDENSKNLVIFCRSNLID